MSTDQPQADQPQVAVGGAQRIPQTGFAAEPQSLVFRNEPCEKHAKTPPGEQSWNDDGSKKRDPNGFDHACSDCQAEAHILVEG